ncbi:MAG: eukaryotic-like serine/threonine-protein kinase, partial [Verrucomicrobiota bacterium]
RSRRVSPRVPGNNMERKEFFEHYRISSDAINRTGAATNYKAIDTRTGDTVMLQLIPLASVDQTKRMQFEERVRIVQQLDHINIARVRRMERDDEYIGLVSEWVEGETVESWIVAHGPMSGDAVLRIGLQVVRALGAAAYLGLSHRAIEPSNLTIVPGQTADGGWPFVKLSNFGLAGLAIYDEQMEANELAPVARPQFASPEQLLDKPIDFRSEMYSLGATMCFLLTGAVPLAVSGMKARLRARRLPELRRAPRALRNLLVHMLRENPDNRPQDPVMFEKEIQNCLATVERRQALGRKFGLPLAAVIPRNARSTSSLAVASQVWRGVLAFAALLLIGGIVAAFLLPEDAIPFRNRTAKTIGVPVGVPPAVAEASASLPPAAAATANTPVVVAANSNPSPAASASPEIAQNQTAEPPPPAEGPAESSSNAVAQAPADDQSASSANESDSSNGDQENAAPVKKKTASATTSSRRSSTLTRSRSDDVTPRTRRGEMHARFVGSTPDGRMILRLPSGRTVAVRPGEPDRDVDLSARPHRRVYIPRDADVPYQPFDPNGPRD